jgi:hypothetical protein
METECKVKLMRLQVANVCIRVCGDEVEVGISPPWDTIGRHEYVVVGTVDEVIKELKQLAEDILKAVKAFEYMVRGMMIDNES